MDFRGAYELGQVETWGKTHKVREEARHNCSPPFTYIQWLGKSFAPLENIQRWLYFESCIIQDFLVYRSLNTLICYKDLCQRYRVMCQKMRECIMGMPRNDGAWLLLLLVSAPTKLPNALIMQSIMESPQYNINLTFIHTLSMEKTCILVLNIRGD